MVGTSWSRARRASRRGPSRTARWIPALAVLVALAGCDSSTEPDPDPDPEPRPAAVEVTSPIGDVMAVDFSVQLSAMAVDAAGHPMPGQAITWASSNEDVALVSSAGLARGLADGTARISATASGVSGSLNMRVVDADLDGFSAVLDDPFTGALADGLSDTPRGQVEAALIDCAVALSQGSILGLEDCTRAVQSVSGTDPTDRALLGVLGVLGLRAELHLGL